MFIIIFIFIKQVTLRKNRYFIIKQVLEYPVFKTNFDSLSEYETYFF